MEQKFVQISDTTGIAIAAIVSVSKHGHGLRLLLSGGDGTDVIPKYVPKVLDALGLSALAKR